MLQFRCRKKSKTTNRTQVISILICTLHLFALSMHHLHMHMCNARMMSDVPFFSLVCFSSIQNAMLLGLHFKAYERIKSMSYGSLKSKFAIKSNRSCSKPMKQIPIVLINTTNCERYKGAAATTRSKGVQWSHLFLFTIFFFTDFLWLQMQIVLLYRWQTITLRRLRCDVIVVVFVLCHWRLTNSCKWYYQLVAKMLFDR